MHTRPLLPVLFGVLSALLAAASVSAAEYHIQKGSSGAGGYYDSLEALRKALLNSGSSFLDNDVIVLHNDDDSLEGELEIRDGCHVSIRSDGGIYNIKAAAPTQLLVGSDILHTGSDSHLQLDRVRISGNTDATVTALYVRANFTPAGTLTINNSLIEDNDFTGGDPHSIAAGAIYLAGNTKTVITNTVIRDNQGGTYYGSGGGAITAFTADDQVADITLAVDRNSPTSSITWSGNSAGGDSAAIGIFGSGSAKLTADISEGKKLTISDTISINQKYGVEITKTGAGVWRLGGDANYIVDSFSPVDHEPRDNVFNIKQGTLQLDPDFIMVSNSDITVSSGAVFKPSIAWAKRYYEVDDDGWQHWKAQHSVFTANSFYGEQGAQLAIGGVSFIPEWNTPGTAQYSDIHMAIGVVDDPSRSFIPESMSINNRLLKANLNMEADGTIYLDVDQVWPLATLEEFDQSADIYRRNPYLSEEERDLLDDIYVRGGSGAGKGHLQRVGGKIASTSLLAMRHGWADNLRRIHRRVTGFQKGELGVTSTASSIKTDQGLASLLGNFVDNNAENKGEIWAYIDKSWIDQDDIASNPGYRYNPYGIGIGYDRHTDQFIYGGLVRYDTGDAKLKAGGAKTENQTLNVTAYASWASNGFYVTGTGYAGMGWHDTITDYGFSGFSSRADSGNYNTVLMGLGAEVGYLAEFGDNFYPTRVTPYGGVNYAKLSRESFSESGAAHLNRQYDAGRWDLYDLSLGVRIDQPFFVCGRQVVASADVAYVLSNGEPKERTRFLADPAYSWDSGLIGENRNALRLGANLNATITKNLDLGIGYDFEWRKKYFDHQLSMKMNWGF